MSGSQSHYFYLIWTFSSTLCELAASLTGWITASTLEMLTSEQLLTGQHAVLTVFPSFPPTAELLIHLPLVTSYIF